MDAEGEAGFPAKIYHYCSTETFLRILESKELWLSDIRHMNDSKEGLWAYELVDGFIKERVRSQPKGLVEFMLGMYEMWNLNLLKFPKVSSVAVENGFDDFLNGNATTAFIACFSEEGDLLSQWRAYANDGRGVAIGFDPVGFGLEARPAYRSREVKSATGLTPVVYGKDEQNGIIADRLDRFLKEAVPYDKAKEKAAGCVADLGAVALTFKNPAFREEREWRIVHSPMRLGECDFEGAVADVRYRASEGNVVGYFPFSFANVGSPVIKEVVLGPKNESAWWAVKGALKANGFANADVRKSSASYR